jgi:hypothetical protein
VTNDRYPAPQWPGETNGPGSSVFGPPTAPQPEQRHAYLPPPAYPGNEPTYRPEPTHRQPAYPQTPSYPPTPSYPDPTRPQPRLPDGGRPPGRSQPPGGGPGRLPRERPREDRDGRAGRGGGGRDRGPGRDFPLGAGAFLGFTGLVCFLLALLVLPWFEAGGQEVTLANMREAFTLPATDPSTLPGATDQSTTTVAEARALPSPDQIQDAVENEVRDAATEAAASAIDTGKARYLELYTETLWLVLAIAVSLAVVFSTILSPRSFALSLLLGFRRLSGFVTILAGIVHGAALWIIFEGTGAPTPAFGVWLGVGGLAAVFVGCIVGPKKR